MNNDNWKWYDIIYILMIVFIVWVAWDDLGVWLG